MSGLLTSDADIDLRSAMRPSPLPSARRVRVLQRTLFTDSGVGTRAAEIARTEDRGAVGNHVEGKVRARASEIAAETGSPDSDANYFRAQREVDQAWQEREKLFHGAAPDLVDWHLMKAGLSREEYDAAEARAVEAYVTVLARSRDLRKSVSDLVATAGAWTMLPPMIVRAESLVRVQKGAQEVRNDASALATAQLLLPLRVMTTSAQLRDYSVHVAKAHGVSPLDSVHDFATNPAECRQLASLPRAEVESVIEDVRQQYTRRAGPGAMTVGPQRVDHSQRLTPDKKTNVGSQAEHAETLGFVGDPSRQLVLGVGRPGDPQGYQDFAKDYGVWDYESWAAWNKLSVKFMKVGQAIDPNNGADVDTVLIGKDETGREIFDKLHFRLAGVFPTIAGTADKLVAAMALYYESLDRGADYFGSQINPMWTLGEVCTIVNSPALQAKTAFYGVDGVDQDKKLLDLLPADPAVLTSTVQVKFNEYKIIAEDINTRLKAHYVGRLTDLNKARKRVADMYFNIPRGADWFFDDVSKAVP